MCIVPSTSTTDIKQVTVLTSYGDTLYVGGSGPNNYTKIQDAIDNASNYDTVYVYDDSSPYYENVILNKSINLIGEDCNTTVVDGSFLGDVIYIFYYGYLTIKGFNIRNSGYNQQDAGIGAYCYRLTIEGNIISNNTNGIKIREGNKINIINNRIEKNKMYGVQIRSSNCNNVISNNYILENGGNGICFDSRNDNNFVQNNTLISNFGGIHFSTSENNLIQNNLIKTSYLDSINLIHNCQNNTVKDNRIIGCRIGVDIFNSHNNTVTNNYISGCNYRCIDLGYSKHNYITQNILHNSSKGILVRKSYNNQISENIIAHNKYGIYRLNEGKYNVIFHNDFIANNRNAFESDVNDTMFWDNGEKGNFWDDYTGGDEDGDGIGDVPYKIPECSSEDRYPLMESYNIKEPFLRIHIRGGLGVKISIKNMGNETAYDINWTISIVGGIFDLININYAGTSPFLLQSGDEKNLRLIPFGIGDININVTAKAINTIESKRTVYALIFLGFVFIPSYSI